MPNASLQTDSVLSLYPANLKHASRTLKGGANPLHTIMGGATPLPFLAGTLGPKGARKWDLSVT